MGRRLRTFSTAVFAALSSVRTVGAAAATDIDIRDFGAKGDGVADDSAAFQAAGAAQAKLFAAAARQWGNLYRKVPSGSLDGPRPRIVVPKGRYRLGQTVILPAGVFIQGEDGAEIVAASPADDCFYVYAAYRVHIENLTFRGGRHSVKAETLHKESANIRITGCRFFDSADTAFSSPSYAYAAKGKKRVAAGEWVPADSPCGFVRNPDYDVSRLFRNSHSSFIEIDRCRFEDCAAAVDMHPDGSVVRNCRIVLPKGAARAAIRTSSVLHAYGLEIVHSKGSAAVEIAGQAKFWLENSSVTTADGSGARTVIGSAGRVSQVTLSDVTTDAALVPGNAICSFENAFPAQAALVRVTAAGPNEVKAFVFGPREDEAAFAASRQNGLWEIDRYFSCGLGDCGANISGPSGYASRFLKPVPDWACRAEPGMVGPPAIGLEKPRRIVLDGDWNVVTATREIAVDTVVEGAGVAGLVGLTGDRPWFIVRKGAKLRLRNLQVRGGRSFVVVEEGGEALVESCCSYDAEGPVFDCRRGGRLRVDCGVYYAPKLYDGEGETAIGSIWYRFTDVVPWRQELSGGSALDNRGGLVVWDLLGVPTVFSRFDKSMSGAEPEKRYDLRWVDNRGDYRSRMMRYGGEWGGIVGVYHHGDAKTLVEGHICWYWNRSVADTPVLCDSPKADARLFSVGFPLYRQYLKEIGLQWRRPDGTDEFIPGARMSFTTPLCR